MSDDRELLELAAKAAGLELPLGNMQWGKYWVAGYGYWNPLADDGDALRLAVKMEFHFVGAFPVPDLALLYACKGDPYAATRRAIVRAAAAIGKEMP